MARKGGRRRGRGQGNRSGGFGRANRSRPSNPTRGSSKAARRARRNARLNSKRGTFRTGKLGINVSARRAAKHLSNTRVAKALGLSGIGNRIANRLPKSWKVKANLKTAIKSKIGEKNYRRTSANNPGSGGLTDQQLADYDFYSKYNPLGITVSQAKKMYANQLREGVSLKQAMRNNKAETGYFEALIPDKKEPTKNIAASTKKQLQSIRSATPGAIGRSLKGDTELPKNRFGGTGNWLDFYRPENQKRLRKEYQEQEQERRFKQDSREYDQNKRALPRPIRGGMRPPRDTIAMMYENILGRKADQGGLDYWRNELTSGRQSRDDIRQNIIRSDEFQGRSEADRQAALRGVEQRRSLRRQTRRGKPPSRRGRPPRLGPVVLPSLRGKGRARPTGKKPTGRGLFPSIAAAMAARGGF